MIRLVLAQRGMLARRALAELLGRADDVAVVAELGCCDQVVPTVVRERPHVAVLDYALPGEPAVQEVCATLSEVMPDCRVLLILERCLPALPGVMLARMAPRIGLLATEASPSQLIESVRRLARGEAVLDVDIAVAALNANAIPLTGREKEVLLLATAGAPPKEIAAQLFLTDGTVRNYLSRITAKTGARTLIEAIRRAQEAGWV
jgi:two-component system, NarL family, response regulator DesR